MDKNKKKTNKQKERRGEIGPDTNTRHQSDNRGQMKKERVKTHKHKQNRLQERERERRDKEFTMAGVLANLQDTRAYAPYTC